jgi:hypothetical protein
MATLMAYAALDWKKNVNVKMSAIAYNIKKLMKFNRKTVITPYQTLTQ